MPVLYGFCAVINKITKKNKVNSLVGVPPSSSVLSSHPQLSSLFVSLT